LCQDKKTQSSGYELAWLAENFLGPEWRLQRPEISPPGKGKTAKAAAPDLQLDAKAREQWIDHSSASAAAVFFLRLELEARLQKQRWTVGEEWEHPAASKPGAVSMWDFYLQYWQPFGELLSDMEIHGMPVQKATLEKLMAGAREESEQLKQDFKKWALARVEKLYGPVAANESNLSAMDVLSKQQLGQLLFAAKGEAPKEIEFVADAEEVHDHEDPTELLKAKHRSSLASPELRAAMEEELKDLKSAELKDRCRQLGLKVAGTKPVLTERLLDLQALEEQPKKAKKKTKVLIPGLGIAPLEEFKTPKGELSLNLEVLHRLTTDRAEDLGPDGVKAVQDRIRYTMIEARLNTCMVPLHAYIRNNRVHGHINLNTETGRLSTRQPNLMAEANGGDYPVRTAFISPPGKAVLVADYAQLELRMVAHLANCPAMVDILCSGGDLHSRTAYKMFEEVQKAVDSGEVWLDEAAIDIGETSKPLVKEHFSELRKRAKTLNFALLYGKTSFSLAKEWRIEREEAEAFIDKWFAAFPEIRVWMTKVQTSGKATGARTIMGRCRPLRAASSGRAERAAGNTPVQGSAADVVTLAMLRVHDNKVIKEAGFEIAMQIHDELFLEGPEENAEVALAELVKVMEDPLPFKLKVPLPVDARKGSDWHEAKG